MNNIGKKILSGFLIYSILGAGMGMGGYNAIANNSTYDIKATITSPTNYNNYFAGELITKDISSGGVPMKFELSNSSGNKICEESKSLPVINGLTSYTLGSQFIATGQGCNLFSLSPNINYEVRIYGDLSEPSNNSFMDSHDFIGTTNYITSVDDVAINSFLDSKTLEIYNENINTLSSIKTMGDSINTGLTSFGSNLNTGLDSFGTQLNEGLQNLSNGLGSIGSGSLTNHEYNLKGLEFSTQMMSLGGKTKAFDFNKDGINEIISKPTTGNGVFYTVNKETNSFENIYSNSNITLDDATNVFISYKDGNFLLHGAFSMNPNAIVNNFSSTAYSIKNGIVFTNTYTVKSFKYGDYITVTIDGKDITFNYNIYSREYQQQLSVDIGPNSGLYDSVTSPLWSGNPFSSEATDYYGGDIKEFIFNGLSYTGVDGYFYGDFNKDSQIDAVIYSKIQGTTKVKFSIILKNGNGINKEILKEYTGDSINIGNSILDNSTDFSGIDIPEIVISNGNTKDIFKINSLWKTSITGVGASNTVTKIASFDSTFYYILGGNPVINTSFISADASFRDMNNANKNDKFLLVGNFKVNKDGYDYYDFNIKKYNGTDFKDLSLSGTTTPWKITGNKIGFKKIGTSNFYAFYVDQSTQWTYGKPDKTNLFYIYQNKINSVMTDVIVNSNNSIIGQDGGLNEGGEKLLIDSKFGFFNTNLGGDSGTFGIKMSNYITGTVNQFSFKENVAIRGVEQTASLDWSNIVTLDNVTITSITNNVYCGPNYNYAPIQVLNKSNNNIIASFGVSDYGCGGPYPPIIVNQNFGDIKLSYTGNQGIRVNFIRNDSYVFFPVREGLMKNVSISNNLQSIFTNTNSGGIMMNIHSIWSNAVSKELLYNAIKDQNWGFGSPRENLGNNGLFNINNNIKLGGRYKISDYITKENFISNQNLNLFYRGNYEIGVMGSSITNIGIANYGTDRSKHSVTNLRQNTSTVLWGGMNNGYLYLDDPSGKVIYIDNKGIGFLEKSLLSNYGGRWIPFLDGGNYSGQGVNKLVFGDKNWNAGQNGYGGTNNDVGGINKNFGLQGSYAYGRTAPNIHLIFVSNNYYGSSWNSNYRIINQYGDVYGATSENIGYYWIDAGVYRYGSYSFFPLY